jgi:hypothetical protein
MTSGNEGSAKRPYCFALPERSHIWHRDPEEYPNGWCDSCDHFEDCQQANETPPSILTLNLKKQYFDQIAAGTKTEEYREANHFWRQRIYPGSIYQVIEICKGYPERGDLKKRMWFLGGQPIKIVLMKWDNGDTPISGPTFVIKLGDRIEYPYQAIEQRRDTPASA